MENCKTNDYKNDQKPGGQDRRNDMQCLKPVVTIAGMTQLGPRGQHRRNGKTFSIDWSALPECHYQTQVVKITGIHNMQKQEGDQYRRNEK
jgi:hypothetical protein